MQGARVTKRLVLIIAMIVCAAASAFGHEGGATTADVSLDEQLGKTLPADIVFRDETGKPVNLGDHITKPTIIAPVYFHCMHVCPMLLNGLAEVLGKLEIVTPGADFQVVALSFDERDTPEIARDKKKNYLAAIKKPFPPDAWKFLTGDAANIRKFTQSVGITVERDGLDFSHPLTIIILAPGGKVVRYLYGTSFLPFTVTLAVNEAAEGKIGSTAGRVLTYCFSYDPRKQSYVFNILKVTGTVIVLFVGGFFIYLIISTRKKRGTL